MSHEPLDRIRGDLETLRQAAGLELPFGRDDVHTNLWAAACGALVALWTGLAPWEYRGLIALPLLAAVAGCLWMARRAHQNRAAKPAPWREHRRGILVVLVVLPAVALYIQWEKRMGLPREMAGAAAVFFVGLAALLVALGDRRRISYLGAALPLMAFGLAIPLLERSQVILAGGACVAVGCLTAAAIQAYQLGRAGMRHGTD